MTKLKPCPFCGSEARGPICTVPYAFKIECKECQCEIEELTEYETIKAWNTRNNNPPPSGVDISVSFKRR